MKTIMKCLAILIAILLFGGAARADNAKKYAITLDSAAKIGSTEFRAGDYKMQVDASKVTFTELKSGKEIEVNAKIETVESKFDRTSIHSKTDERGARQISEIRIGGSKTRIAFD